MSQAEVQAADDLREFHEVAKKASYKVTAHNRGSLDGLGLTRDDYEMQLLVSAWEARKRYRSDAYEGDNDDERHYCFQAIWNTAKKLHAQRVRPGSIMLSQTGQVPDTIDPEFDIEARYNAAESLALLREHFSESEWGVFESLAETPSVLGAYHGSALSQEIAPTTWFERVVKLRARAKKLLEEE